MNKEEYKAHLRQRLYIKEDFVKDVKTIRATRDEFWRTGKPPAGISSVTSKSAADLGDRVAGVYRTGDVRTTIIEPKSNTSPGIIGLERNPTVEILDPNDAITALQKQEAILTRSIRRNRNLEKAAATAKTTGVHEFAHALQDQRQIQNELELYVQKHGKLPDSTWMRKSGVGLSFRETATQESRGKKRNRLKAEADGVLDPSWWNTPKAKAKKILTKHEADLQYWNRDVELHARSVQYADKLYDGRYKQGIQTHMKRKPNMSIDSILATHRNWAIRQVNRQEQGLTTPKNLRNIHQRMGLVMADIEKEMDLTSPEKIKAFRDSKLPPPTKPEFAKNLEPRSKTGIEKAVGVVDDLASAGKKLGKGVVNSIDVAIDPLGYALEKAAKGILDTVKGGVKSGLKSGVKEVVKGGVKGVVKGGVVSAVGGIIGDQLAKHVAVPALEKLGVYDAVGAVSKKAFDNMPSWAVDASERVLAAGERIVDNPVAFAIDALTSPGSFINPQGTTTITANTKTEIEKRKDFDNHIRKNPQLTNDEVLELTKKEEERMKKESPSDSEMTSKHTAPVVATSDKISNWFDRNVINPIFGESYDTSREQYKEYIRSLLLEKYSRI